MVTMFIDPDDITRRIYALEMALEEPDRIGEEEWNDLYDLLDFLEEIDAELSVTREVKLTHV